jgi:hypothetical protein
MRVLVSGGLTGYPERGILLLISFVIALPWCREIKTRGKKKVTVV